MTCKYCGLLVIYYECSNGSRVFFDPYTRGGGNHLCSGRPTPSQPSRINRRTGAISMSLPCGACGKMVKQSRIVAHLRKHFGHN
jgi:hypothetical protein